MLNNNNKEYKYKLQYICNDTIVTHEFRADLEANEMTNHLRDFLCGCSWKEDTVENDILNMKENF